MSPAKFESSVQIVKPDTMTNKSQNEETTVAAASSIQRDALIKVSIELTKTEMRQSAHVRNGVVSGRTALGFKTCESDAN